LKEGGKTGNSSKESGQASNSGHLRHITEDLAEDDHDDSQDDEAEELGNDTNDASLQYFARITNHYLRTVVLIITCLRNWNFLNPWFQHKER
jgi:hypothetical protein